MFTKFLSFSISMCALLCSTPNARAAILINEFLADPPAGIAGDANGDGVGSNTQDEFVELWNSSGAGVDLTAWSLSDAVSIRHIFSSGTSIGPGQYLVIFGGGTPDLSRGAIVTASTGTLSLNNTGDTISLFDAGHGLVDQTVYGSEGNKNQSLALYPQTADGIFQLHSEIPEYEGRLFSPGEGLAPERALQTQSSAHVPDLPSVVTLISGVMGLIMKKRHLLAQSS